jgi:SHS2 domain-containing protein
MDSGHRAVPHTADIRIEAWAPTREECFAQAVLGLVESFADVSHAQPTDTTTFEVNQESVDDRLVAVLDEVLYLLDTQDVLPLSAVIEPTDGGDAVRFELTNLDQVELIGAVPKAVSLHDLRVEQRPDGWSCAVTVDV